MQIAISYREIQRFILHEFNKEVGIKYLNPKTLSVSFSPNRFIPSVRIDITIEEIRETAILLSYSARRGINLIIRGLISFMDEKMNKDIISIFPDKRLIYIQLYKIKGAQKTLEYLEPKDIRFVENGVMLDLAVK